MPDVEYIARMDSDDISLDNRLETQVAFMQTNPDISLCGSSVETFSSGKSKIMTYPCHNEAIKYTMLFYCCLAHPTMMFKRAFFEANSYTDGRLEDYLLWISLIHDESIRFSNIGSVLLRLRKHPGNVSKHTQIDDSEVRCKREFLKLKFGIEVTDEVVSDFIQVTGRSLKN